MIVKFLPTCKRCGRALKNDASQRRGMGPTCAAKAFRQVRLEKEGQQRLPGFEEKA